MLKFNAMDIMKLILNANSLNSDFKSNVEKKLANGNSKKYV